jgi:GDP-L-fucose synthase
MFNRKKVLVTGATGFLGRHLVKKLKSLEYDVSISNTKFGNLNNIDNMKIYNTIKFDYIFHLAARTKAGDYTLYHKGDQWMNNQLINTNILCYWKEFQPQAKMVAFGTSCSYSPEYTNLIEENYLDGIPDKTLYTYAMTKRMLLVGLKSLSEQYNLKWVYLIPSTLYGPEFELDDSHFIFDLVKKIHAGKHKNQDVVLWGDGYQKRELIYIDDAIDLILSAKDVENEVFNLGTNNEFTIRDYATAICNIVGYDVSKIIYDTTKYVGVRSKRLNMEKYSNHIKSPEFTPLELGISKTVNYYSDKVSNL